MIKKYKGKHCMYALKIDSVKKIFHAHASGFFTIEDGTSFLNDYDTLTKSFISEEYTLIIDIPELEPSLLDVEKLLELLLKKYITVPFKSRFLITAGSVVTLSQFKVLGSKIPGWTESVQYVNSYEEVVEKLTV